MMSYGSNHICCTACQATYALSSGLAQDSICTSQTQPEQMSHSATQSQNFSTWWTRPHNMHVRVPFMQASLSMIFTMDTSLTLGSTLAQPRSPGQGVPLGVNITHQPPGTTSSPQRMPTLFTSDQNKTTKVL